MLAATLPIYTALTDATERNAPGAAAVHIYKIVVSAL
jgi:hypothetical protein